MANVQSRLVRGIAIVLVGSTSFLLTNTLSAWADQRSFVTVDEVRALHDVEHKKSAFVGTLLGVSFKDEVNQTDFGCPASSEIQEVQPEAAATSPLFVDTGFLPKDYVVQPGGGASVCDGTVIGFAQRAVAPAVGHRQPEVSIARFAAKVVVSSGPRETGCLFRQLNGSSARMQSGPTCTISNRAAT